MPHGLRRVPQLHEACQLLGDEDYRRLQAALIANPDLGDLIRGTGGLRKARWSAKGRGKRGGVRVIYYWVTKRYQVLMLSSTRKALATI